MYTADDYQEGKNALKDEFKKRYPWMTDDQLEKMADDIMREMNEGEAIAMKGYQENGQQDEAEDMVKKICERIPNAICDPQPPQDQDCPQGQNGQQGQP